MREIKFRAFKKVGTKEMFEDIAFIDFEEKIVGINYKVSELTTRLDQESLNNLIIMQYTGLKDKNGVEIYEGDILRKKSFWPFYIGFQNGLFIEIPCNKTQRVNKKIFSNIKTYVNEFEVTGNIYENPELLEV